MYPTQLTSSPYESPIQSHACNIDQYHFQYNIEGESVTNLRWQQTNPSNITGLWPMDSNNPDLFMYDWWGENAWGAGDIFADGQSMTVSIGSVTANFGSSVIPTGQSLSAVQGTDTTIEIATEFELNGQAATLSLGTTSEIAGDANV